MVSFPDLPDGRFEPTETLFFCENLAKTAIVPIYIRAYRAHARPQRAKKQGEIFFIVSQK
jgi:hypothetical protein